jgi:lysophospholipase L1-like esterase
MRLRAAPLPKEAGVYTVVVDDRAPRTLDVTGGDGRYEIARDLDPKREHVVSVTRESEAFAGAHQFLGFELAKDGELLKPPDPARLHLLFVGDSISCGYGVLGPDRTCPFSFATERASAAYPWLVGRALHADVTTVCWSGRGIYRNYDPGGELMPVLFERTLPEEPASRWPFSREPQPDAVIVNLGTNDFLADHDGDGAPDVVDTRAFEERYEPFLARIRAVHRTALLVVTTSPMLEGALAETAKQSLGRVVERRRAAGESKLELLRLEEQGERLGCDSHPNAAMHGVLAKQVTALLARRL